MNIAFWGFQNWPWADCHWIWRVFGIPQTTLDRATGTDDRAACWKWQIPGRQPGWGGRYLVTCVSCMWQGRRPRRYTSLRSCAGVCNPESRGVSTLCGWYGISTHRRSTTGVSLLMRATCSMRRTGHSCYGQSVLSFPVALGSHLSATKTEQHWWYVKQGGQVTSSTTRRAWPRGNTWPWLYISLVPHLDQGYPSDTQMYSR